MAPFTGRERQPDMNPLESSTESPPRGGHGCSACPANGWRTNARRISSNPRIEVCVPVAGRLRAS